MQIPLISIGIEKTADKNLTPLMIKVLGKNRTGATQLRIIKAA